MTSNRDLMEAHAYERHRLLTAFVRGGSGDREAEPLRPGRPVVGGFVLAMLVLAGSVVAAAFDAGGLIPWHS